MPKANFHFFYFSAFLGKYKNSENSAMRIYNGIR